jgi:hypothetical protein
VQVALDARTDRVGAPCATWPMRYREWPGTSVTTVPRGAASAHQEDAPMTAGEVYDHTLLPSGGAGSCGLGEG